MSTPFYTVESLGRHQHLTPEGFLVISDVPLARTGPQLYSDKEIPVKGDSTGRVIIYRDADEVFRPETIASLQGKPVAIEHPSEDITPENYKDLAVGTVLNPRRGEGVLDNLLIGDLVITCPDAIKQIREGGLREVSVGYEADYQDDGGGRGSQHNILCNHLALVRDGRCGPVCRIGDAADQSSFEEEMLTGDAKEDHPDNPLNFTHDKDSTEKATKESVDYEDRAVDMHTHCGNCEYYLGKNGCDKVEGLINPDGWCRLHELSTTTHDSVPRRFKRKVQHIHLHF